MEYTLKDKLTINNEFLKDLETKSWQEIEHLQNQIANIEDTAENAGVLQLLKSLLTSYYVFTGGLENLGSNKAFHKVTDFNDKVCADKNITTVHQTPAEPVVKKDPFVDDFLITDVSASVLADEEPIVQIAAVSEPFEYFVDFDDPIGEPISDQDLYGK